MEAVNPRTANAEADSTPEESASAMSGLPFRHSPAVARYAPGPFITPREGFGPSVIPSAWNWRNCHVYLVTDQNGRDWRCLRVSSPLGFVGYWAVEMLGQPLEGTHVRED